MRALITNDDGVSSTGIAVLTQAAVEAGLDVVVAAPHENRSGASAAISMLEEDGRLLVDRTTVGDVEALAVHASPAMIVLVGLLGAFGDPPDIILSGINHGANNGRAVLHSGTVGAALAGVAHAGIPGLAVSMAGESPAHWDTALAITRTTLDWFIVHATQPYVLNLNVPDIPVEQVRGIRTASLANFGTVEAKVGERGEGYVVMTFSERLADAEPGSDVRLLAEGWATVSALQPPIADAAIALSSLE